jgi:predicted GNAT family acetyltransferase
MPLSIQHDPERSRFHVPPEALDDEAGPGDPGHMANLGMVVSYKEIRPGVIELKSTLVPPHLRGHGLGTEMVRQVLDWARREGYQIVPLCPFVADFLEKNPEYQDLLEQTA